MPGTSRSQLGRRVVGLLLSIPILALGVAAVWFGVDIFIFGINEAPYSNAFERIFNIWFGGVVMAGSVIIPVWLLYSTYKGLIKGSNLS